MRVYSPGALVAGGGAVGICEGVIGASVGTSIDVSPKIRVNSLAGGANAGRVGADALLAGSCFGAAAEED